MGRHRRFICVEFVDHDLVGDGCSIALDGFDDLETQTTGFFFQRLAGMFADERNEFLFAAFVRFEFNDNRQCSHRISASLLCNEVYQPPIDKSR